MKKQTMEFAVVTKKSAVQQIGKSTIIQPKIDFRGGEAKWFDDSKLLKNRISGQKERK